MRQTPAGHLGDVPTDVRRPGERELVDIGMDVEGLADDRALAGDDVEDAGRKDPVEELGHLEDRQRSVLGRLEDDRVAGGERGRGLERRDHQRRVPREDAGDDAQRHPLRVLELPVSGRQGRALDLTGDAAHVAEEIGEDDGLGPRLRADRVAGVERGELSELLRTGFERVGALDEQLLPLLERQSCPFGTAARAALTARSASASLPSGTVAMTTLRSIGVMTS